MAAMEKQAGNRLMDTVGEGEGVINQAVALMDLSWSHPPQGKEPKSPFPTFWKGTWQCLQRMGPEPTSNLSLAGPRQVEHTGLPRRTPDRRLGAGSVAPVAQASIWKG